MHDLHLKKKTKKRFNTTFSINYKTLNKMYNMFLNTPRNNHYKLYEAIT